MVGSSKPFVNDISCLIESAEHYNIRVIPLHTFKSYICAQLIISLYLKVNEKCSLSRNVQFTEVLTGQFYN